MTSQPQPIGSTQPISMHVSYQSHFVNCLTIVWTGLRGKMNVFFAICMLLRFCLYTYHICNTVYTPINWFHASLIIRWHSTLQNVTMFLCVSSIALVNIFFGNLITKPVLSCILGEIDICITSIFNSLKNFNNRNQFIW